MAAALSALTTLGSNSRATDSVEPSSSSPELLSLDHTFHIKERALSSFFRLSVCPMLRAHGGLFQGGQGPCLIRPQLSYPSLVLSGGLGPPLMLKK